MRRLAISFFIIAIGAVAVPQVLRAMTEEKFAVYYSDREPAEKFRGYQLLVLDAKYHPPLPALAEDGKTLLGYVSLGEVEKDSPFFAALKQKNMVGKENPNWPSNYVIDLRNPFWAKTVIEEIIPSLLHAGFDGIFFDTLDSALDLERINPEKYAGMDDAAVHLIQAVRMNYPAMKIMVNRAYPILPRIAPSIDMELGESVYADYNFDTKKYGKVAPSLYRQQVQWLEEAKRINPRLKIYTLDYALPKDDAAIADIYRTERANGFIPYVATVKLDRLVDEQGAP